MRKLILTVICLLIINYTYSANLSQNTTNIAEDSLRTGVLNDKVTIQLESSYQQKLNRDNSKYDSLKTRKNIPSYFEGEVALKKMFFEIFTPSEIDELSKSNIAMFGTLTKDGRYSDVMIAVPKDHPILSFEKHKVTLLLRRLEAEVRLDTSEWSGNFKVRLSLPLRLINLKNDKPITFIGDRIKVI